TMLSSAGATRGAKRDGGSTTGSRTRSIRLVSDCGNSCRPVSSSHRMMPTAYRSVRPSSTSERACSGDMYETLPYTTPGAVFSVFNDDEASPKSVSLTSPKNDSSTLGGETSRCTSWSDEKV